MKGLLERLPNLRKDWVGQGLRKTHDRRRTISLDLKEPVAPSRAKQTKQRSEEIDFPNSWYLSEQRISLRHGLVAYLACRPADQKKMGNGRDQVLVEARMILRAVRRIEMQFGRLPGLPVQ